MDATEPAASALPWEGYFHRDAVLFVIDAGMHMHVEVEQETAFTMALRAALRFMHIKLVSSPKDYVGIMLWNTDASQMITPSKNPYYPHTIEYARLKQVDVPTTFELQQLLTALQADPPAARTRFPPASSTMNVDHVFANALHVITASVRAGTRRVFFLTNQDEPHAPPHKKYIQKACIDRIRDYYRRGIEVEPFFLGSSFRLHAFYADILGVYDDGLLQDTLRPWRLRQLQDQNGPKHSAWDSMSKFAELEEQISSREMPKRVVLDLLMDLGPLSKTSHATRWRIHVKGYNLISEATRDLPVKVTSYGHEDPYDLYEVVNITRPVRAANGEPVQPEQITNAYELRAASSHDYVTFSDEEMQGLRQCGSIPGLVLLGFKDRSTLHFYENIKHAYFLYPSDLEHPGSKCAFAALLQSMLSKDKLALTLFTPRENTTPSIAVLLPQAEELDEDGQQCQPPGMHLIVMPFADDIRTPPPIKTLSAKPEQVGAASKIIESYTRKSPFNPDVFVNPALQFHYDLLVAQAFHTPMPTYRDTILPDYDMIERRSRSFIQAWHETLQQDARVQTDKAVESSSAVPDDLVRRLHRQGTLGQLTVHDLKQACDMYGLRKHSRKAELVDTLSQHLSSH